MIRKIESEHMGKSRRGWLTSWFHFSFAEYYNPDNIHFGALRVINDDLIAVSYTHLILCPQQTEGESGDIT